jgi:hypothetical protein
MDELLRFVEPDDKINGVIIARETQLVGGLGKGRIRRRRGIWLPRVLATVGAA